MREDDFRNFVPKRRLKWKKISEGNFEVTHIDEEENPTIVGCVQRNGFGLEWKIKPYFSVIWSVEESHEKFDSEVEAGRKLVSLWERAREHDFFDSEDAYETIF